MVAAYLPTTEITHALPRSVRCPRYETPLRAPAAGESLDAEALFLREIHAIPLLSEVEERRLALRMRRGDDDAKRHLYEANLRLAWKVAGHYATAGATQMDVAQEAALVMWRKMGQYDPSRGRFSTYMWNWLMTGAKRGARQLSATIRRPEWLQDYEELFWRLLDQRLAETGGEPTEALVDELLADMEAGATQRNPQRTISGRTCKLGAGTAKAAKVNGSPVISYTGAWEAHVERTIPTDEDWLAYHTLDYPEASLGADTLSEATGAVRAELSQQVLAVVLRAGLTEKEGATLALRYAYDWTLQRTGDALGVSRERVRQYEVRALTKLRHLDTYGRNDLTRAASTSHASSNASKLADTPLADIPSGALATLYTQAFSVQPSQAPVTARKGAR